MAPHHTCSVAYQPHDHHHCIDDALISAKKVCVEQGAKLTPLREKVLALIWQSHKPLGAYEILAALSEHEKRTAAPPTVYRALDFLQAQGLVHRIASLNAYIGCCHPEQAHRCEFLICRDCGITIETHDDLQSSLSSHTAHGFKVEKITLEIMGLCPTCQQKNAAVQQ